MYCDIKIWPFDLLKRPQWNGRVCSFEGPYMKYFYKCKCFIINIIHVWCINASSRREHFKFEPFVYTILSIKYVQTKPYMYKNTSFTDLGCESLSYTWMILSSKCSVKKFKLTIAGSYNINSALARYNVFQNNQHNSSSSKMCRRVMLESTTILSVTTCPGQKGFFPLLVYCCNWIVPFLICLLRLLCPLSSRLSLCLH